jgi:putative NADPH-quinone reductase
VLADAYAEGAQEAGHEVKRIGVVELKFPFLRSKKDWESGLTPEAIGQTQAAIAWTNHLVILYPLWLGAMPALLKGFLEQALQPAFAFEYQSKGMPKKLLKGKSAHIIVTMGMPALVYRWLRWRA